VSGLLLARLLTALILLPTLAGLLSALAALLPAALPGLLLLLARLALAALLTAALVLVIRHGVFPLLRSKKNGRVACFVPVTRLVETPQHHAYVSTQIGR
jgi:hypothetical protein